MNRLDRLIGYFSPERAARRVHARVVMTQLSYEGARKDRRTEGWITAGGDADAESQIVASDLRNRARDLVRNNPHAAKAVDVKVTETVGVGIMAEVKNRDLRAIWDDFVANCDYDGVYDLHGLQALIERCRFESGECLVQFIPTEIERSANGKPRVPLKLRVMEPDFLDSTRDTKRVEGGYIRNGIQYDAFGRRTGYWLYPEHPGVSASGSLRVLGMESRFVPAKDVLHVFRRLRPGQTRGVTEFAPVIMRMRDLDDYDDAEVVRKRVAACLSAWVYSPDGANTSPIGPVTTDGTGNVVALSPGMVNFLKPGENVTFTEPTDSGGYADFQRFSLRAIAAGTGIPYELMTGDLSQVNYSSYRAGLINFRRRISQDQQFLHVRGVCVPLWTRFLAEARAAYRQPELGARTTVEWTPPRYELVDPLKETQAELEAVLAGFDSWDEVVRRRGWTSSEQLDRIEEWQSELKKRGIALKSDYTNEAGKASSGGSNATPREDAASTSEGQAA
jgi:lambda family phage portal protein